MKIGTHNTADYVWDTFKTNDCTTEYCADGDGFVTVHKVEENGFLVASVYGENKLLQDFAMTKEKADQIVESVRNDEPDAQITPVSKGEVLIFAEAILVAKHTDLDVALREAESYANATYPGMLDRAKRCEEKGC